jgi:hypothetical protein
MSDSIPSQPSYVPGVCNINHAEIARRRLAGHIGISLFIVVLALLLYLSINRWYRLILFVPAFLAAIGYLQAKNKFCVGYGGAGMQNASDGSTQAEKITDKSAVLKDRLKTKKLNLQAALIALFATIVSLVLPHI